MITKYQAGYSRTMSRDAIAILGLVNGLTHTNKCGYIVF